jgi:hypothetical protein
LRVSSLSAQILASTHRACRPVVAIRDIQARDLPKCIDELAAIGARYPPDRVPHLVGRHEIEERRAGDGAPRNPVDRARRRVSQKDRTRLRAEIEHVAGAVVFLVLPRAFVLPDDIGLIFVDREARRDSSLLVLPHPKFVEVLAWRVFYDERSIPP